MPAPPMVVYSYINESNSTVTSFTINATNAQTAGNTNVLFIGWNSGSNSILSFSDTSGNTYTGGLGIASTTHILIATNINAAAAGANTITVNFTGTGAVEPTFQLLEITPCVRDVNAVHSNAQTTVTAVTTGAATTSYANELAIGFCYPTTTVTVAGSGWCLLAENPTATRGTGLETQLVYSAGTSVTATFTITSGSVSSIFVCFYSPGTGSLTPEIIQAAAAVTVSGPTSATFNAAQTSGNTNVVFIGYQGNGENITSVTDTSNNTYTLINGIVGGLAFVELWCYMAHNIKTAAASSNTVKVTFSVGSGFTPEIYIIEISASLVDPVGFSFGTASSSTQATASITTTFANELLIGYCYALQNSTSIGTGWNLAFASPSPNHNYAQYTMSPNATNQSITVTTNFVASSAWIQGLVAFYIPTNIISPTDAVFYGIT
jgi:hypothetical protein